MWVKLDDRFFSNPKIEPLSKGAKLLYLAGLTYCAERLTDGRIDPHGVKVLKALVDVGPKAVTELVDAGRWEKENGSYYVHDWQDYNPPAAKVRADRAAAKARMKAARSPAHSGEQGGEPTPHVSDDVHPPPVPVPVSSMPEPTPNPVLEAAAASSNLAKLSEGYESEIGALTAGVDSMLKDWAERIPDSELGWMWIDYAFAQAVAANRRTWNYVEAILRRGEAESWPADPGQEQGGGDDERMVRLQDRAEIHEKKQAAT